MKISVKKLGSRRLALDLVVLACLVLLGVTGWLWWARIVMNPDRALNDTINNSLRTKSVTKHIKQDGGISGNVDQVTYISFYPPAVTSQSKTVLAQGGGSEAASITTETIGTKDADYVSYTAANNTAGLPGADKLDTLFGKWAKRSADPSTGEQATFLNESIYGIIPFGNLDDGQRAKLMDTISQKDVYKYTSVERQIQDKRPVYVYDLSINAEDLVGAIQEYLQITGIGDPSQLNPDDYKGSGNLSVRVTVDILSRQLTRIEYPTGRIETYGGQNLYHPADIPKQTIPVEELQRRLQGA